MCIIFSVTTWMFKSIFELKKENFPNATTKSIPLCDPKVVPTHQLRNMLWMSDSVTEMTQNQSPYLGEQLIQSRTIEANHFFTFPKQKSAFFLGKKAFYKSGGPLLANNECSSHFLGLWFHCGRKYFDMFSLEDPAALTIICPQTQ